MVNKKISYVLSVGVCVTLLNKHIIILLLILRIEKVVSRVGKGGAGDISS